VLVHGLWGNPDDWRQVKRLLQDAGVHVRTPDLPSHRSPTAGLADDAAEVRDAIRSCAPAGRRRRVVLWRDGDQHGCCGRGLRDSAYLRE
jgi:pimeloyl-ACP methyl ester carboxylesterase